ncbi:MAG: hypothetical protein O2930_01355 [Acidobacteria bacterium]|nr:hypothetical protein [Acidobacteriota bacterium]
MTEKNGASRMDLDSALLMLSLIPSGVGFVLFVYGRKVSRWPQLIAGLRLMVYPYFAGDVVTLISVGALLGGGLYVMIQAGW